MNMMELVSTEEGRTEKFPVGMRVLAVDDNPNCLQTLVESLLLCKYHVTKTTDSKKALEMIREKSNMFDLVITDVEMPDMDGFKLLEVCLAMDLPVIMLSAHSDYASFNKSITHGACDYYVKPVGLKELQTIWRHVVKKNISSHAKNIDPSHQLLPSSESHFIPRVSREHNGQELFTRKHHRVIWSRELHHKFLNAYEQLGRFKAVPKHIHALMNVEGLTREDVASHLQKYLMHLKRYGHRGPTGRYHHTPLPSVQNVNHLFNKFHLH